MGADSSPESVTRDGDQGDPHGTRKEENTLPEGGHEQLSINLTRTFLDSYRRDLLTSYPSTISRMSLDSIDECKG